VFASDYARPRRAVTAGKDSGWWTGSYLAAESRAASSSASRATISTLGWAVVLATVGSGVIAAASAILAAERANRHAERRAISAEEAPAHRDRLADLRAVAGETAVALHELWQVYGPFLHALHPNENVRYPDRSPVGGDPDPLVWNQAVDKLSAQYARLAMRLPGDHPLLSSAGLALNRAQVAWNDIVLHDPQEPTDDERRRNIVNGVAMASEQYRKFLDTARELFGVGIDVG